MKKIAAKIALIIIILGACVYFIANSCISNVYEITYDTYVYSSKTNDLSLDKVDNKFTLRAHNKTEAKEKVIDMIYLNEICISDKPLIKSIVEL